MLHCCPASHTRDSQEHGHPCVLGLGATRAATHVPPQPAALQAAARLFRGETEIRKETCFSIGLRGIVANTS